MAFALSQIFVVSEKDANLIQDPEALAQYYDLLTDGAFKRFKELLRDITLSPTMGQYLTMNGNKPQSETGQAPDQNYAREVMQLFTIGLYHLNMDGSLVLNQYGEPTETYQDDDIEALARVFTGWDIDSGNTLIPMVEDNSHHDMEPKQVLGESYPAGQTARQDLEQFLDHITSHPNVAPFISTLLIKRLTTSNPSSDYVYRVATTFDNTNGDLAEVVRAIYTDSALLEARNTHMAKVREPILAMTYLYRAMEAYPGGGNDIIYDPMRYKETFNQYPLGANSVFNFYQPDYRPPGALAEQGLTAPELGIIDWSQLINMGNIFYRSLLDYGQNRGSSSNKKELYIAPQNLEDMATSGQGEQLVSTINRLVLNQGEATALLNIGTLVEPTNKINLNDVRKPNNLGAHNKQQVAWQSSWGESGYHPYGWAGLMMDVLSNETLVSDSMSFASNEWLTGVTSKDLSLSSGGIKAIDALGHSNAVNTHFSGLVNSPYGSDFKQTYNQHLKGILDFQTELQFVVDTYDEDLSIPSSSIGLQLRMVRRMMQAATDLGHQRQVFFVNLGGFDNHRSQRGRHDGLLETIDLDVSAFHRSLAELNLSDKVVTYTASDFGRTIENNSNQGTDHGWGSNQLVVGRAVNGGLSYGHYPSFIRDGEHAWGNKFIPSQSSEQLGATLCRWMGLSEEGVDLIFPTLSPLHTNAFASRYLGFIGDYLDKEQESELNILAVRASETRVDHTPEMAIDGDPLTKWTAKGTGIQYVIELANTATVNKLLYSQAKGDVRQYLFDIEVSNNGSDYELVTQVLTPGNTTAIVEQQIGKSGVNFIRLICNGNNGSDAKLVLWNNFQELKLVGRSG